MSLISDLPRQASHSSATALLAQLEAVTKAEIALEAAGGLGNAEWNALCDRRDDLEWDLSLLPARGDPEAVEMLRIGVAKLTELLGGRPEASVTLSLITSAAAHFADKGTRTGAMVEHYGALSAPAALG